MVPIQSAAMLQADSLLDRLISDFSYQASSLTKGALIT